MKVFLRFFVLLLCAVLVCSAAAEESAYLLPGSDTRVITEEELWVWDRESLSYMFNEIMARHGFVFGEGGEYDTWFRQFSWYTPNDNPDNQTMVYNVLSNLEWDNYTTIKKVAAQMDANGEPWHNPDRKCYRNMEIPAPVNTADDSVILLGFQRVSLPRGNQLPVYAAPSYQAWRGNDGRAQVDTSSAVWSCGWENGWLLICCGTDTNAMRVGYIDGALIPGYAANLPTLKFAYQPETVTQACPMTDDPMVANTAMIWLQQGAAVTFLTTVTTPQGQNWDYIETTINGQQARGFIPSGILAYAGS
ncbi:MAG: YARHG domain-containing protein [Clostridia bacterium]|nr:YARHG domain-containing protein [Clostridia bacterium]